MELVSWYCTYTHWLWCMLRMPTAINSNIYLNEILHRWEVEAVKWIQMSRNKCLNMLLFADDQVIM
jgi:hypothetical protein